jgi:hypothetical protein
MFYAPWDRESMEVSAFECRFNFCYSFLCSMTGLFYPFWQCFWSGITESGSGYRLFVNLIQVFDHQIQIFYSWKNKMFWLTNAVFLLASTKGFQAAGEASGSPERTSRSSKYEFSSLFIVGNFCLSWIRIRSTAFWQARTCPTWPMLLFHRSC